MEASKACPTREFERLKQWHCCQACNTEETGVSTKAFARVLIKQGLQPKEKGLHLAMRRAGREAPDSISRLLALVCRAGTHIPILVSQNGVATICARLRLQLTPVQ